jgi:hypothetical protein
MAGTGSFLCSVSAAFAADASTEVVELSWRSPGRRQAMNSPSKDFKIRMLEHYRDPI